MTPKHYRNSAMGQETRWNDNEIRDKCVRNGDEEQEVMETYIRNKYYRTTNSSFAILQINGSYSSSNYNFLVSDCT